MRRLGDRWHMQSNDNEKHSVGVSFTVFGISHSCRRRYLPKVQKPEPQPQKTRVRLWLEGPTKMIMCRDKAPYGDWQEIHHDAEGFYVEEQH